MHGISEVVGPVLVVLTIAWVVRTYILARQARASVNQKVELQTQLLNKFSSPEDLHVFLASESGTKFLESATLQKGNPFGRILASIQAGLILLVGGAAFFAQRNLIEDAFQGFTFIGTLGMFLGVGFLLSALVSYQLSKSWGLLDHKPPVD